MERKKRRMADRYTEIQTDNAKTGFSFKSHLPLRIPKSPNHLQTTAHTPEIAMTNEILTTS